MPVDRNLRILLADDQDTFLEIMREMLRKLGFRNVDVAKDGIKAINAMSRAADPYGLVISDWNMQPMTGHALLKEIRADPDLVKLPVIMVTAETTLANVMAAKEAGANGYIVKPFNGETLKGKIAAVMG